MTSYFHLGREIDEPLESRIQSNIIALRNRTSGNDGANGEVVEADGFITVVPDLTSKPMARCMGAHFCKHAPRTCTADPEYQAQCKNKREAERGSTH